VLTRLQCGIPDHDCGERPRGRNSYGRDVSGVCSQAGRFTVLVGVCCVRPIENL
jgi:hypothetical protein